MVQIGHQERAMGVQVDEERLHARSAESGLAEVSCKVQVHACPVHP